MNLLRQLITKTKLLVLENTYTKTLDINLDQAIFSFTFDDVPVSAATNGARILEAANSTGTYYVALGMENVAKDKTSEQRQFLNNAEIIDLHARGHNIGCHTYSHLNLRHTKVNDYSLDCEKNTSQLKQILGVNSIDHFSYPFGMIKPAGKKGMRHVYQTLRTTDHGINVGKTDLSHLRAVSLYSGRLDKQAIKAVIADAVANKAWLIFYTHDVRENPSQWGIKPDDFEWVVGLCQQANGHILNVEQAFANINPDTQ